MTAEPITTATNFLAFLGLVSTLLIVWRQNWAGRRRLFVVQSLLLAALATTIAVYGHRAELFLVAAIVVLLKAWLIPRILGRMAAGTPPRPVAPGRSAGLSLLAVLRDGKAIETATVGREGVVGAMAGLGLYKSLVRVVVQMPMACSKIAAPHFRSAAAASDSIRNLCIRYNEVLLSQARVTAACNALHSIEARFCRWLLQSADRAASDTVPLTQEFLAEMLGVRRTSVTEVASKVQAAGAIIYSRGVIKILDRPALLRMSCECYETLLDQSAALA